MKGYARASSLEMMSWLRAVLSVACRSAYEQGGVRRRRRRRRRRTFILAKPMSATKAFDTLLIHGLALC